MQSTATAGTAAPAAPLTTRDAVFPILVSLGFCHLLNDLMQSLLPALYPMLKAQLHLDFSQIGMLTLAFMLTASFLQPSIGMYTDRKPQPYSLAVGMGGTLTGLLLLSMAESYSAVLLAAAFIGTGSVCSTRKPRASRARPRAGATASRSRSSRSAATSAAQSARCSPPSSSCRAGRARSRGSRWPRCSR